MEDNFNSEFCGACGVVLKVPELGKGALCPSCQNPDLEEGLECGLLKATECLSQLKTAHQVLVEALHFQEQEKARILEEINVAVNEAFHLLKKREDFLLNEVQNVEDSAASVRTELSQLDEKIAALEQAVERAREVKQFPSLKISCDLKKLLTELCTPAGVQACDFIYLSLGSGLSCSLETNGFIQSLNNNLKITSQRPSIETPDGKSRALSPSSLEHNRLSSGQFDGTDADTVHQSQEQESHVISTPKGSSSMASVNDADVIIEKVEEFELENTLKKPQKLQRRRKTFSPGKLAVWQRKVLQEWVFVSHVVNPNHFYIQYLAEKRTRNLLDGKIKRHCSGERGVFGPNDTLESGSLVFVRQNENIWWRAILTAVFLNDQSDPVDRCPVHTVSRVHVFFQDYGVSQSLYLKNVKDNGVCRINESLRKADLAAQSELQRWAPQAVRCSLKDIVPVDQEKGWCEGPIVEFQRVVDNKAVEMQVFGQEGGTLLVDLRHAPMDKSASSMPVSLREYLVFLELARFYAPITQNSSMIPSKTRLQEFCSPAIPKPGTRYDAIVCHVSSPSDFYIQMVDNMESLLLNARLQEFYSQDMPKEQRLKVQRPVLNQACVALFDRTVWYRAEIIGLPSDREVEVRYVDFGNKKLLSLNDVRQIKDEFFLLPAKAIHCCLADIEPLGTEEEWSEKSKERFQRLVRHKLMSAIMTEGNPADKIHPVKLFQVLNVDELSNDIGEILVKDGLALSKMNVTREKDILPTEVCVWDPPFESLLEEFVTDFSSKKQKVSLDLPTDLQPSVKNLSVRVTHVTSPGSFFIQLLQNDDHLQWVHEKLKEEYEKSELEMVEWKAQMDCAAYVNGVWNRGRVCSVSSSTGAEVFLCDFGYKVKLHLNQLRPLKADLIGCFALECSLCDIRSAGGCSTWTATACDFMSYCLTGSTGIITIKDSNLQQPVPVTLCCSLESGPQVSVADLLVSEGLALRERRLEVAPIKTLVLETSNVEQHQNIPLGKTKTQPYSPPVLPHCGPIQMTITGIAEDGVIYAMTQHAEQQFLQLKKMQQHITLLPTQKPYSWKRMDGCVVMGPDLQCYRGQVLEVIGGHLKVQYIDQGLVENIPTSHVYPMVLNEDVPQLCVPCQLHGVIPVDGVWQPDALALLKELLHLRCVAMQIMEVPVDPWGHVTVQIMLDGMALGRIIVHHQYATEDPTVKIQEEYDLMASDLDPDDWEWNTIGMDDRTLNMRGYTCTRLPKNEERFPVQIKHVCTPNEVFLCPLVDSFGYTDNRGESLEEALAHVNDDVDSLLPLSDFPYEGPCLVEYDDGKYYRAKILSIESCSPVQVLVQHVDFGSDDTVSTQRLREIPSGLLRFPCNVVKVKVAGFRAPRISLEKERLPYCQEWSFKALLTMVELLHGNICASVLSAESENTVLLYNDRGALVHLPLLQKGLADED